MNESLTNQLIGQKIKMLRNKANLTQAQLADELSIHTKHLCNIENGRKSITIALLDKLCGIFKKPHVYFFDFLDYEIEENNIKLINSILYMIQRTDNKTRKDIAQIIKILVKKD